MTGDDFITLAGWIVASGADAARCRSAISRAYYGAFHLALDFIEDIGCTVHRNASAHIQVQRLLKSSGHHAVEEAGSLLEDLHSDRNNADYRFKNTAVEDQTFAKLRVEMAMKIRSALKECEKEPIRTAIKTGLQSKR
jgi:uncharacterized protein (UPF0332 family)